MIGALSVHTEVFRSKAKELRARGECVHDSRTRDGFLRLAEEYDRLASCAEEWSATTNTLIAGLTTIRDAE